MNNAIKFHSPERQPKIVVTTTRDDGHVIISVKDNGIGMHESITEAIFSKYYRSQNSIEGSGIGLYLVKEIVTHAGGMVLVESELGKGSEFKVYLRTE